MKKKVWNSIIIAGLLLLVSCRPKVDIGPIQITGDGTKPTPIVVPSCTPTSTPTASLAPSLEPTATL